jgi:hypothetical protein
MLNNLLNIADMALQYHRGKQVGLWGLVGIALVIITAAAWDVISPIFDAIGIVSLLDRWGLIYEGAPEITAFKIIVAFIALCIAFSMIGTILLILFALLMAFSQTKIGKYFLTAGLVLILFPLLLISVLVIILFSIPYFIYSLFTKNESYNKKIEELEEESRLNRNKREINLIFEAGAKEITFEETLKRLNRIPTEGDSLFLLGISYERDIYMLLPKPYTGSDYLERKDVFFCEKLNIKLKYNTEFKKYVIEEINVDFNESNRETTLHGAPILPYSQFEQFIDPYGCKPIERCFENYRRNAPYKKFVSLWQNYYFNRKKRLLEDMEKAQYIEEFEKIAEELKHFNANNEDIVRLIWEANNQSMIKEGFNE